MEFQIFIESEGATAPYFEPVFAPSIDGARVAAIGMLRQRPKATRALIYDRDELLTELEAAAPEVGASKSAPGQP